MRAKRSGRWAASLLLKASRSWSFSRERHSKIRLVVLISGRGSNLQAILDQAASGELPVEVAAVISNRPGVYGLERARQAGVPALELDHQNFADRPGFEAALIAMIDRYQPDLVILAGFMRVADRRVY
jgi:phosphoribosylglycinamide formyltransferase-1